MWRCAALVLRDSAAGSQAAPLAAVRQQKRQCVLSAAAPTWYNVPSRLPPDEQPPQRAGGAYAAAALCAPGLVGMKVAAIGGVALARVDDVVAL